MSMAGALKVRVKEEKKCWFLKYFNWIIKLIVQGAVSLVTGGASGLGRATVERFLKNGAKVVICDLPSSTGAELADQNKDNAVFCPTDVRTIHILY